MILKYNLFNIGGTIIKDDEYCLVRENRQLGNILISSYLLYKDKTTKHLKYSNMDCLYLFIDGTGVFEIEKELLSIKRNDIILIPQNKYHKIINDGDIHMKFLALKEKM